MSKIRNTGITDKWGFRHTCYVASAAQNLKDLHNCSLLTCSHLMAILKSLNNTTDFVMILAWLCRFKFMKMSKRCALAGSPKHLIYSTVLSPPPPFCHPIQATRPSHYCWAGYFCFVSLYYLNCEIYDMYWSLLLKITTAVQSQKAVFAKLQESRYGLLTLQSRIQLQHFTILCKAKKQ